MSFDSHKLYDQYDEPELLLYYISRLQSHINKTFNRRLRGIDYFSRRRDSLFSELSERLKALEKFLDKNGIGIIYNEIKNGCKILQFDNILDNTLPDYLFDRRSKSVPVWIKNIKKWQRFFDEAEHKDVGRLIKTRHSNYYVSIVNTPGHVTTVLYDVSDILSDKVHITYVETSESDDIEAVPSQLISVILNSDVFLDELYDLLYEYDFWPSTRPIVDYTCISKTAQVQAVCSYYVPFICVIFSRFPGDYRNIIELFISSSTKMTERYVYNIAMLLHYASNDRTKQSSQQMMRAKSK